ncbi:MAG: hypothetical protein KGJ14_03625, partial [Nitrospirota bacterium]|nr:hypothetical protein [Nitrospirota bacterium]
SHTPIIFVTAIGKSEPEIAKGYALGAVDYLFKPYSPDILKAKVAVFVDLHCLRAQLQRQSSQLADANARLEEEIGERRKAEALLAQINAQLTKQARDLEAANQDLEAFAYSVSHDLRAPLRHVEGFTGLLRSHAADKLDETAQRYMSIITESVKKMGGLIEDLLDFSRVGRKDLLTTTVRLEPLVQEVRAALEPDVVQRKIEWRIGPLPDVVGDQSLIRQVLANLIGNAVKYTRPRETARIEVGTVPPEPLRNAEGGGRSEGPSDAPAAETRHPQSEIVVFVRDNGVGFDMRYAHKLFGVFQRLHSASQFEGTGIGLALVRRIVQRHGGRTWAEGEPGKGATFYCTLPSRTHGTSVPSGHESDAGGESHGEAHAHAAGGG